MYLCYQNGQIYIKKQVKITHHPIIATKGKKTKICLGWQLEKNRNPHIRIYFFFFKKKNKNELGISKACRHCSTKNYTMMGSRFCWIWGVNIHKRIYKLERNIYDQMLDMTFKESISALSSWDPTKRVTTISHQKQSRIHLKSSQRIIHNMLLISFSIFLSDSRQLD